MLYALQDGKYNVYPSKYCGQSFNCLVSKRSPRMQKKKCHRPAGA